MESILRDLYHGRFSAWERRPTRTAENIAVNRKIEDEKRYFIQKMSLDDCARFQVLDGLYSQETKKAVLEALCVDHSQGALFFRTVKGATPECWHEKALTRLFDYGGHRFYK